MNKQSIEEMMEQGQMEHLPVYKKNELGLYTLDDGSFNDLFNYDPLEKIASYLALTVR